MKQENMRISYESAQMNAGPSSLICFRREDDEDEYVI